MKKLVALTPQERHATYDARRQKMLDDKIDCAKFLTWFIENYSKSVELSKNAGADFWEKFR